jgi:transcriptional regulator with XRE-family HTH domain
LHDVLSVRVRPFDRVKKFSTQRATLHFGLRVVEERESKGMTQEQLSERIGLSPRQLQRLEAGKVNVKLLTIYELARTFGIDVGELFRKPSAGKERQPGRPPRQRLLR